MKNIEDWSGYDSRPDLPGLMFAGIGPQTPFMLRFFDAYLRNLELPTDDPLQDLVG